MSIVLSKLGLKCSHEGVFHYNPFMEVKEKEGVWGDASWMATPQISTLPSGTIVLHQVRDPIKVLNSNLPPGGDSYFRTWDENAGLDSDPLYGKDLPWKRYIWKHTKDWVWPNKIADEPESSAEIERLIHWWMNWNLWIEYATLKRSDLVYVRYRIEDVNSWTLTNLVELLDPSIRIDNLICESILQNIPTTTNRHRTPNSRITIDMLPPAVRLLMIRYGYDSI